MPERSSGGAAATGARFEIKLSERLTTHALFGWGLMPETPETKDMINREIVAKELYTTYCAAVGGVAFNGDPLPDWDTFAADPAKEKHSLVDTMRIIFT